MEERGHGYHIEMVFDSLESFLVDYLQPGLQTSDLIGTTQIEAKFDDKNLTTEDVFLLAYKSKLISFTYLIVSNKKNNTNEVIGFYPIVQDGTLVRLKLLEIKSWPELYQAELVCGDDDGQEFTFFDTHYFINKNKYKIGQHYNFQIGALSDNIEAVPDPEISISGEVAQMLYEKIGKNTLDIDPKDLKISTSEMVAFLQLIDEDPALAQFQAPLLNKQEIQEFNYDFERLEIKISQKPDIIIPLYIRKSKFSQEIKTLQAIQGILWLQGKLVE